MIETISLTLLAFISLIYYYFTMNFSYFKKQGIPGPTPIPIFGTMWGKWNMNAVNASVEEMKQYGRTYGCFNGRTPVLITSDPDLMKKILIENFDHFSERPPIEIGGDSIKKSMAFLNGHDWTNMRGLLNTALTTSKLKKMISRMKQPTSTLVSYFKNECKGGKPVEINGELAKTGVEVLASSLFGFELNTIGVHDHKILKIAKQCKPIDSPELALALAYGTLGKILTSLPLPNPYMYFIELAKEMVSLKREQRKAKIIKDDDDYLSLMLDALESDKNKGSILSNEEAIVSNISTFLSSPLETLGVPMIAIIHQMAINLDFQQKIRDEVLKFRLNDNQKGEYEYLNELKYLEASILESLRLYPASFSYQRICVKDIDYPEIKIKKGVNILIPIYAIHHDEKFFEDPEKFMPERFLNKEFNPIVFNAFGQGPRNCSGKRIGMMAIKLIISELVINFEFFPVSSTQSQLQYRGGIIALLTLDPVSVGMREIN